MNMPVTFCLPVLFSFTLLSLNKKLDGYKFPVIPTKNCPRNENEWKNRSAFFNCKEGHSYACFPNDPITGLIEYCYNLPRVSITPGVCLYLSKRRSEHESKDCNTFTHGCPKEAYSSETLYKYPVCTEIKNGCFVADPHCESATQVSIQLTSTQGINQEDTSASNAGVIAIGIIIPIITICIIMVILWKKRALPICNRKGKGAPESNTNAAESKRPLLNLRSATGRIDSKPDFRGQGSSGENGEEGANAREDSKPDFRGQGSSGENGEEGANAREESKPDLRGQGSSGENGEEGANAREGSLGNVSTRDNAVLTANKTDKFEEKEQAVSTEFSTTTWAQDVIICSENCESAATHFCNACQDSICKGCVEKHRERYCKVSHDIVHFKKRQISWALPGCPVHPEKRCQGHCTHCNCLVCFDCVTSQHSDHKVTGLTDFVEKKKMDINQDTIELETNILPECKSLEESLCKKINENREKKDKNVIQEIEQFKEVSNKKIDSFCKKVLGPGTFEKNMEELSLQKRELSMLIETIVRTITENRKLLRSKKAADIYEYKTNIKKFKESEKRFSRGNQGSVKKISLQVHQVLTGELRTDIEGKGEDLQTYETSSKDAIQNCSTDTGRSDKPIKRNSLPDLKHLRNAVNDNENTDLV